MEKISVKVKKLSNHAQLPSYATDGSAACDIFAAEDAIVEHGNFKLIKTGLSIELPAGYEAQIRPRSGLALKHGVTILNTPGTLDEDYRGELCILLMNHGKSDFRVSRGDRIAQMLISKVHRIEWEISESLSETKRGSGGFGHSGMK